MKGYDLVIIQDNVQLYILNKKYTWYINGPLMEHTTKLFEYQNVKLDLN